MDFERRVKDLGKRMSEHVEQYSNWNFRKWQELEKEIYELSPEVQRVLLAEVTFHRSPSSIEFWENAVSFFSNCFHDDSAVEIKVDRYRNPVLVWGREKCSVDEIRTLIQLYRAYMHSMKFSPEELDAHPEGYMKAIGELAYFAGKYKKIKEKQ